MKHLIAALLLFVGMMTVCVMWALEETEAQTGVYTSADGSQGEDERMMKIKLLYRDGSTKITGTLKSETVDADGDPVLEIESQAGRATVEKLNLLPQEYTDADAALAATQPGDIFAASIGQ